jgi:hypothetical protein
MGVVLDLVKEEIEKTIHSLEAKTFLADPIAGPHFSKITRVMSSAYKRHGFILERSLLEALKQCPHFEAWREEYFNVPSNVDHKVNGSIEHGAKLIGVDNVDSTADGRRRTAAPIRPFHRSDRAKTDYCARTVKLDDPISRVRPVLSWQNPTMTRYDLLLRLFDCLVCALFDATLWALLML